MQAPSPAAQEGSAHREKRLVALWSVLAAVGLTVFKVVVGLSTGSIGILSEAAHSGLDLVAAALTLLAVRAAGRPADREHAYGHGKVENLSALVETGLLLAACAGIVWESVRRLAFREVQVEVTPWSFVVMAVSIAVDVSRSRALSRAARKYGSQALEADALHFSTDVWSSSVVIAGLLGVALAGRLGAGWLGKADAVAALGVAAISVWVSVRLGRKSVDDLLDAAPPDLTEAVAGAALVPGVSRVRQVRLRRSGAEIFADVTVEVPREASLERAHDAASEVERAVRAAVGNADVVVHVEPVRAGEEGLLALVRLAAARHGLGAHAIRSYRAGLGHSLDVHLEVPGELTVGEADALVRGFEAEVRDGAPGLVAIHVHTEPVAEAFDEALAAEAGAGEREKVRQVLCALWGAPRAEALEVVHTGGGLRISFRFTVPAGTSTARAREQALEAERRLRERVPGVARVLVRLQPPP
ncbi:MAG TPA: cation diffusion facilitator family transporter [Anaeromyxobacter sp.]|nr:cation diffusion facilitator family transporter [Anaeromyxobacter sp.]